MPRRRSTLAAIGLLGVGVLTGCATGTPGNVASGTPTATASDAPSTAGEVSPGTTSGPSSVTTTGPPPTATTRVASTIPDCGDRNGDWLMAAEDAYGSEPMLGDSDNDVAAWAEQFDDFAAVWGHLDRPGRLTVGFTGDDLPARQAAVREAFPGRDVAAVTVAFTDADAEALGARVRDRFPVLVASAGGGAHMARVAIDLAVRPLLERSVDDVVAEVAAAFPGEPLCVHVPTDLPTAGPQPDGGDGWRLLAATKGAGEIYQTGIATGPSSWADLWSSTMGDAPAPEVDFETEVAIWFGDAHSGSCDHVRLDDVVVNGDVVHIDRVVLDGPICTADANPLAWFVAVDRDLLPDAPFTIQLEEEIQTPGLADQVTRVTPEMLAGDG